MEKKKKIIIMLLIFIIIIITSIVFYMLKTLNEEKKITSEYNKILEDSFEANNQWNLINKIDDYIFIKECINKYINYSDNVKNDTDNIDNLESITEQLKSILPKNVINEMEINDSNIYNKVGIECTYFIINKIYSSLQTVNTIEFENETNIYAYYVNMKLVKEKSNSEESSLIVLLDKNNSTFCIMPESYLKYKKINLNNSKVELYKDENIANQTYNVFSLKDVSDEEKCKSYFTDFKNNLIYDLENVYEHLDENYSKAKFNNIDDFNNFINQNYSNIRKRKLEKYIVKILDNNQYEYICKDQEGDIYIFYENSDLSYTLLLDTYTIDIDEFINKYENVADEQKVGMNIEKIIDAINHKDYKYVYNKLYQVYKKNYFDDIQKFSIYIKAKFFEKNEVKYIKLNKQGEYYIYNIRIIDKSNNNNYNEITVLMKLKDGTDFEISFGTE